MKIGLCHNIFRTDLDWSFARAAEVGADGVEVLFDDELMRRLSRDDEVISQLRTLKARHKLEIPSLGLVSLCSQPSLISRPELIEPGLQTVRRGLEVASALGAGVLLLPFFGKNLIETEAEFNFAVEAIAQLAEPAEEANVILGIESTLNASQQLLLLASTGHSPFVRVYFDTGNVLARKYDVVTLIRELGCGNICQVHLKDVRLADGARPDFEVALGQGSVDFRAVLHALRACRYEGYLVLETPPLADPLESAKANMKFARELVAGGAA